MKHTIVVVIPAYNEAEDLVGLLPVVLEHGMTVVVVDDGSLDKTAQVAGKFTPHVLSHGVNLGKGAAMLTGAEYAFQTLRATGIIFMDGDGQHDPQELAHFREQLESGEGVVFGIRDLKTRMPKQRVVGNVLISLVTQLLFGTYIPDILSGFKAFSRQAFQAIRWEASGYEVEMEIAVHVAMKRLKYRSLPIQTIYFDLQRGMNILDSFKAVGHLLSLRWRSRYT